jgi:hypothetical protein
VLKKLAGALADSIDKEIMAGYVPVEPVPVPEGAVELVDGMF